MVSSFVWALLLSAVSGMVVGVAAQRILASRAASKLQRIPLKWQLQARRLFTDMEGLVWLKLKRDFFEHHVLLKVPVIRFLYPRSAVEGKRSHELLKGVYCSFTVCATDGSVIGCIDVPGSKGLPASNRDLKQKLFAECGIAYAVLSPTALPTLEVLRAAFLGDSGLNPSGNEFARSSQPPLTESDASDATTKPESGTQAKAKNAEPLPVSVKVQSDATSAARAQGIDMIAVVSARSNLKAKLEQSRKTRIATIESLSASMGIVDDTANKGFVVQWDDSFIMDEETRLALGDGR